jgi:hypothetical protein
VWRRLQPKKFCKAAVALLLIVGLFVPVLTVPKAAAAPVLVQSASNKETSTSSAIVTASFSNTPTAGNLLIVVCSTGASLSISTPSGFSIATNEPGSGFPSQGIFYKKAAGTVAEKTNTCTFSATNGSLVIQIYEYSGMHGYMALDAVNTATSRGNNGTSFISGSVMTTHANDLIFASVISDQSSIITSWSNSFTAREANGQNGGKQSSRVWSAGADFIATSAGTYSTIATTSTSGNWRGQIVAFRSLASPLVLGADIVNASGASVTSPTAGLSSLITGFGCQASTGTLGTATQKIRIVNNTDNPAWTMSLAATGGNTSTFTSGTNSYKYNNPAASGCTGGQLTVNVGSGSLVADPGCDTTGIALGSSSAFNQGVTDQITLATGNTSAPIDCAWNITNIPLSQKVPAEQKAGNYSINFTITLVAN